MSEKRRRQDWPHDLNAEIALLGNLILRPSNLDEISRIVTPSDFYSPAHSHIYSAILELWNQGAKKIDTIIISDLLQSKGLLETIGGSAALLQIQTQVPSTTLSSAHRYAEIVLKMSSYRSVLMIADEMRKTALSMGAEPTEIVETAKSELEAIGIHLGEIPPDVHVLDEYLSQPHNQGPEWLIPGLLREQWRVMIVAPEGIGKSVLLRQIAILSAQGIHPLHFGAMQPIRSLIVDLENPEDSVVEICNPINEKAKTRSRNYHPDRAWLWHRPSGINLRKRRDRIALETIVSHTQPQLVCLGPLYKAYEVAAYENDELAAREIMAVLDDLRTRYGFALLLEHHAPKETAGMKRKLMPYGSSLWLRWPEIGINLQTSDSDQSTLVVGRWRGDRLKNEWPTSITRNGFFPWTGVWPDGYFNNKTEPQNKPQF